MTTAEAYIQVKANKTDPGTQRILVWRDASGAIYYRHPQFGGRYSLPEAWRDAAEAALTPENVAREEKAHQQRAAEMAEDDARMREMCG